MKGCSCYDDAVILIVVVGCNYVFTRIDHSLDQLSIVLSIVAVICCCFFSHQFIALDLYCKKRIWLWNYIPVIRLNCIELRNIHSSILCVVWRTLRLHDTFSLILYATGSSYSTLYSNTLSSCYTYMLCVLNLCSSGRWMCRRVCIQSDVNVTEGESEEMKVPSRAAISNTLQ